MSRTTTSAPRNAGARRSISGSSAAPFRRSSVRCLLAESDGMRRWIGCQSQLYPCATGHCPSNHRLGPSRPASLFTNGLIYPGRWCSSGWADRGNQQQGREVIFRRGRKVMALPQSFEPISNAVHLSVDMQNLFAPAESGQRPGWSGSCLQLSLSQNLILGGRFSLDL